MISEGTFGLTTGRGAQPYGHLDAFSCVNLIQKLYEQETLRTDTQVFITHITHYTSAHEQLVAFFKEQKIPCPVTITYDGMQILP